MYKWLELTIILNDYNRTNEVLATIIKPYIAQLYSNGVKFSWHYFREPSICLRVYSVDDYIKTIKKELHNILVGCEKEHPELYDRHYYGAFLEEGREYIGESILYGEDAWELCYKRWEAGSNLALMLCTSDATKAIPFHYTRDIHLFENQLGLDFSDTITIYLKWIKRLMECEPEKQYVEYIPILNDIIAKTFKPSSMKGL